MLVNKRGPKIESWGTPHNKGAQEEEAFEEEVHYMSLDIYLFQVSNWKWI